MQIDKIVRELVKNYNTSDPFELASYRDIKIFEEPLGKNIKEFYQYDRRIKMIFINSDLQKAKKKVVCAREQSSFLLSRSSVKIPLSWSK